jgi:ribosomal protein S18 acetylase RimI-like enzyme
MTVRPRRPDDVAGCVTALAEVHRLDGYPTRWPADAAAWLTPERLLAAWVATADGRLAGHVALVAEEPDPDVPSAELASVSRLFVRPAARGQRIGEALLGTATAHAVEHGFGLVLDVVAEERSPAIALYERLGWRFVAERPAWWLTPAGERPRLRRYLLPEP